MTALAGRGAGAERPVCGARLPWRRAARGAARARVANGTNREDGRGWLLLPKSGWRRVDTIRVPRLFG